MQLQVLTYNIHKGFTSFNREFVLEELRTALRSTHADFALLQEVLGDHSDHKKRIHAWPTQPQFEFLPIRCGRTTPMRATRCTRGATTGT